MLNQTGVEISLTISDDGSTDKTLEIARKFQNRFKDFRIIEGPRLGPAENFFAALRASKAQIIAFSDQDDIWLDNHLTNAVVELSKIENAGLYFSRTIEFQDGKKDKEQKWNQNFHTPNLESLLVENIGRGCTFVLNRQGADLVNRGQHTKAIMHDWYILLVVFMCGQVHCNVEPDVKYRIHEGNFVGVPSLFSSKKLKNFLRVMFRAEWQPIDQVREIMSSFEYEIQKHHQLKLQLWLESFSRGELFHKIPSERSSRLESLILKMVWNRIRLNNLKFRRGE
jgi:glycosyltransferase involved in cell wall biosynthesis